MSDIQRLQAMITNAKQLRRDLEADNDHHAAIYLDIAVANMRLCLDALESIDPYLAERQISGRQANSSAS